MANAKTPEEIMAMKSNANAIIIQCANELGPSLIPKLIMECNNADYWHKFVVENVDTYERDFILKTIIDFVHPADMIPLNFVKKKRAFFLARNCLDALLKLASSKLMVPNPLHPDTPLKLIVIANHCPAQQLKFDFERDIVKILRKRYNTQRKFLDLKEFHKDKDLKDFFPLSQPKLLLYVLQFAMELQPQNLDLSNNSIKAINPIRLLTGCKITSIDLGNNDIARMEDLEPLKDFTKLNKIVLNGNPLCNGWDPQDYVKKLNEICPNLESIDGQDPLKYSVFSTSSKNFLCSTAGGDLVSQFLEHFFMVYDSENRQNIAPLYHTTAMFSVTHRIIPKQKSSENVQLDHYRNIDRNMKGFGGPRHHRGQKAIMDVFAKLPRTNHDPFEFRCDLIYYTGLQAALVVNGVFREDKRYIAFARNFVLKCEDNAYTITNDQLHVYNALDFQIKTSDCYPIRLEICSNPLPFYPHQYTELQKAVHKITNLNYDYSQRYLEAYNYDLKKVLESFMEMHLKDELPPEAFIQEGMQGLLCKEILNVAKAPFPKNIVLKTHSKHPAVSPRTVWQTLKNHRLAAEYKMANKEADKSVLDAEAEQIKRNILKAVPSNSTPVQVYFKDMPENTEQSQDHCQDGDIEMVRTGRNRKKAPWYFKMQMNPIGSTSVSITNQQSKVSDPSVGATNQQSKVSNPSMQGNGQLLQDTQLISMQKSSQPNPVPVVHNNLEQTRPAQAASGPSSQKDTATSVIDLTNDKTASISTSGPRKRKRPPRGNRQRGSYWGPSLPIVAQLR